MDNAKNVDEKRLVFQYSFWKKCFYLFLFIAISIFPLIGCASEGILWVGILIVFVFFLIFDFVGKKLFCKIIIEKDGLVYKQGGVFWKFINENKKKFSWKHFNYTIYYCYFKNKIYYSDLYITDNDSQSCFYLKGREIADFSKLVNTLKHFNQNTELRSIEDVIRKNGIWKAIKMMK
ncbi:MAG: hypothetical protein JRJ15_02460 [Deltaproteobacteria bacterium]|nr:hypothetical protein [Deltaproteobacteria bacterium]